MGQDSGFRIQGPSCLCVSLAILVAMTKGLNVGRFDNEGLHQLQNIIN